MEIKLNKDIREFKESVLMGFTLRQSVCAGIGLAAAVGVFALGYNKIHMEVLSWLSMAAVLPFAAIGFVKYNGMQLEEVVAAFIRHHFLTSKTLYWQPEVRGRKRIQREINKQIGKERKRDAKNRKTSKTAEPTE